jgi:hypothetical protein
LEGLLAQLEFVQEERLYPDFPATALNLYERCPAAFYLQYLLGIREDILACVFQEAEAAAAHRLRERAVMLGTLVHRALEGLIARPAFDEADLRERLREYAWAEYAQAADDEILNHAVRHAAAFTRSEIFQEVTHADEAHSELPFVLKLRSGVIRGQMDLIYRKDSRWHILDYKTSRVDETSGGLRVGKELLWREYRPQVECYAVAASRLFPGCRAGLHVGLYLTGLGQEAGAYFDADKLARAEKELETKAEEIRSLSAESFMAARRPACDSCAYGTARLCQPGKRLWLDARQRSTVRPVTGEAPAG